MSSKNAKLLDEMTCDQPCHCGEGYCILKEIILHDAKYKDRLLVQFKLVDKFKLVESTTQQQDVGWTQAWELWVSRGYAIKFAELYDTGLSMNALFNKIIN